MEVRALVRSWAADQRSLDGLPIEIVHGDLSDPASLADSSGRHRHAVQCRRAIRPQRPRPSRRLSRQRRRHAQPECGPRLRAQVDPRRAHTRRSLRLDHRMTPARPADENAVGNSRRCAQVRTRRPRSSASGWSTSWSNRKGLQAVCVLPTAPIGTAGPEAHAHRATDPRRGQRFNARLHSHGRPQRRARRGMWPQDTSTPPTMGRSGERYILGHRDGNLTLRQNHRARRGSRRSSTLLALAIPLSLAYTAAVVDEYLVSTLTRQQLAGRPSPECDWRDIDSSSIQAKQSNNSTCRKPISTRPSSRAVHSFRTLR